MTDRTGSYVPFLLASGLAVACLLVVLTLARRDVATRLDHELAEARVDFLIEGAFLHAHRLAEAVLIISENERVSMDISELRKVRQHLQNLDSVVPFDYGQLVGRYRILNIEAVPVDRSDWTVRIVVEAFLETRPEMPPRSVLHRRKERILRFGEPS